MDVVFSGWVDQRDADFLKVRSEAVRILKETLEQAGIDVPYPIQTVLSVEEQAPRPAGAKNPPRKKISCRRRNAPMWTTNAIWTRRSSGIARPATTSICFPENDSRTSSRPDRESVG
jgi:hypothetical protein